MRIRSWSERTAAVRLLVPFAATVAVLGLAGCSASPASPAAEPTVAAEPRESAAPVLAASSAEPQAATDATTHAARASVLGRDWVFTWLDGYDGPLPGLPPLPGFILTAEGGRMTGVTGCNRMSSGYQLDEDAGTLRFTLLLNTRMMCNRAAMSTEQAVLGALIGTDAFRLDGDTLELLSKSRPVARLTSR